MARRETFCGLPLPNIPQLKEDIRSVRQAHGFKDKTTAISKALQVEQESTCFAVGRNISNSDLDPAPPEARTWGAWAYTWMWCSNQFSIAVWSFGASFVSMGFTFREIVPLVYAGTTIVTLLIVTVGHLSAKYRVGFPVVARLSWGTRGSAFPVFIRGFVGLMWLAISNIQMAGCYHQMIRAIWPSFDKMPNHLPESAGITSNDLGCYILAVAIQTPLTFIPLYKLKWFFLAKGILSPLLYMGTIIWALKNVPNGGPLVQKSAQLTGTAAQINWIRLKAVFIAAGGFSTVATNFHDFGRFATSYKRTLVQVIAMPLSGIIPVACAVVVSSCCMELYGEAYWNPPQFMAQWDSRAAVFFSSLVWILSTIGINLSDNSIAPSISVASFFPRYINFARAGFFVGLLSILVCPWKIVYSATSFVNFLSVYPAFLGPIIGINLADYYLVRRRKLDVRHLYVRASGKYSFWHGFNWRAFTAFFAALAPNMPGLINAIDSKVPNVEPYTFDIHLLFAVVSAGVIFWGLNFVFPPKYSLSGDAVYPDDVVDWTTRTRIGDWSDIMAIEGLEGISVMASVDEEASDGGSAKKANVNVRAESDSADYVDLEKA